MKDDKSNSKDDKNNNLVSFILKQCKALKHQGNSGLKTIETLERYAPFLSGDDKAQLRDEFKKKDFDFLIEKFALTTSLKKVIDLLNKEEESVTSLPIKKELLIRTVSIIHRAYVKSGELYWVYSLKLLAFINLALDTKEKKTLLQVLTTKPAYKFLLEVNKQSQPTKQFFSFSQEVYTSKENIEKNNRYNSLEKALNLEKDDSQKVNNIENLADLVDMLYKNNPSLFSPSLDSVESGEFKKPFNKDFGFEIEHFIKDMWHALGLEDQEFAKERSKEINTVSALIDYDKHENTLELIDKNIIMFNQQTKDKVSKRIASS